MSLIVESYFEVLYDFGVPFWIPGVVRVGTSVRRGDDITFEILDSTPLRRSFFNLGSKSVDFEMASLVTCNLRSFFRASVQETLQL